MVTRALEFLVAVLYLSASLPAAIKPDVNTEIIIDDSELVQVGKVGFSFTGKWSPSTGGMDYDGESHWAPNTEEGQEENVAYFRPKIEVAGIYEVFIIYPDNPNADHAMNMPVTIHYGKNAGQSEEKSVNLTEKTGEWNNLGTHELYKGKKSYIEFGSKADGNMVADACKFILNEPARMRHLRIGKV